MEQTARIIDVTNEEPEVIEIRQETQKYLAPISIFHVVDSDSMKMADNTVKDINSRLKAIDEKLEPKKKIAYQAYKEWLSLIDELKKPLEEAKKYLQGEGKRYLTEQERIRQEEEARLREIARIEEENRKLREAEEAEKAGNHEEAEAILEEEIYVPPPVVEKTVPKVDNRLFKKQWKWRVIDINKVPVQYKIINETMVNGIVRSMKGSTRIPGIEVYED